MNNLSERDQKVIWHPFTPQKNMLPPIPIVSGNGTLLYAEDGSKYIDAISSWWVTLHGHAHPYIAAQLYKQAQTLEQVIFAGFTHEPAVALAEQLLPLLPGKMSRIFYSDNGSTSTEVALKMATQYWWNKGETNRKKIVAFRNSYHGDTFGAMSMSERSVFTLAFADKLFDVLFIDIPTAENFESLQQIFLTEGPTIAAFIFEPLVQGAGGINMYQAAFLDELILLAQQQNIICIADEVMTGFGRTGKMFACDYLETSPDIICLSKGLTGGTMALGVTACTHKIYEAYLEDNKLKTFFHGHSFTANPLACTAALASLHLLQQQTCRDAINSICTWNANYASTLVNKPGIKNIRQQGTILAFEIDEGEDHYLNTISASLTAMMLKKEVYLRPLGNTVYLMPPYCITQQEYATVTNALDSCLELLLQPNKH